MNIFNQGYPSLNQSPSEEEIFANMYRSIFQNMQPAQEMQPMMNHPQGGNIWGDGQLPAEAQNPGSGQKDMSGFANYGMQSPPLQDPMAQLKMLMGMQTEQEPFLQKQQGNLMNYLRQLGAI